MLRILSGRLLLRRNPTPVATSRRPSTVSLGIRCISIQEPLNRTAAAARFPVGIGSSRSPGVRVGALATAHKTRAASSSVSPGVKSLLQHGTRVIMRSLQRQRLHATQLFSRSWGYWKYGMPTPEGVVLGLIGANIGVYLLWRISSYEFMNKHFMISLDNFKSGRLHTLVTCAFSHADSGHLLTNMVGLYFFGANIGRLFGPQFLVMLYLAGALGGSVFFLVQKAFMSSTSEGRYRWDHSRSPALGASAAVNGVILLDIFLFPKNTCYLYLAIPVPAILLGTLLIGSDLLRVYKGDEHVSGSAHLGGAVVAALAWVALKNRWI